MRHVKPIVAAGSIANVQNHSDEAPVKSAWDPHLDPHYGDAEKHSGQSIIGQHSFKGLREDMNTRRRQTAARVEGRRHY